MWTAQLRVSALRSAIYVYTLDPSFNGRSNHLDIVCRRDALIYSLLKTYNERRCLLGCTQRHICMRCMVIYGQSTMTFLYNKAHIPIPPLAWSKTCGFDLSFSICPTCCLNLCATPTASRALSLSHHWCYPCFRWDLWSRVELRIVILQEVETPVTASWIQNLKYSWYWVIYNICAKQASRGSMFSVLSPLFKEVYIYRKLPLWEWEGMGRMASNPSNVIQHMYVVTHDHRYPELNLCIPQLWYLLFQNHMQAG